MSVNVICSRASESFNCMVLTALFVQYQPVGGGDKACGSVGTFSIARLTSKLSVLFVLASQQMVFR